ncbi:yfiS [Acrasis kona]|uniref:YfiS n=1 Tax=Acrasis kona TaxID=1008807 RepID=A0AAW2ZM75_9EUKA
MQNEQDTIAEEERIADNVQLVTSDISQSNVEEENQQIPAATSSAIFNIPVIGNVLLGFSSYFRILVEYEEFRWIWIAGVVTSSHILPVYLQSKKTVFKNHPNNGLAVGSVFLSCYIPPIILMPISGVVADVFDRRKVMLFSDVSRMFLVLCFLITTIDPHRFYWLIYVVTSLIWSFNSFFDPCREGLVPLIVRKEDLLTANALESLTWMCFSFVGSFLGGVCTSYIGTSANFILDSVAFLVSSLSVAQLFRYASLRPENIKIAILKMEGREQLTDSQEVDLSAQVEPIPVLASESSKSHETASEMILNHIKDFFIGIKFTVQRPYIFSLIFLKAVGALNWASLDFVAMKLFYQKWQPEGIISDAAWVYGLYRAMVGLTSGFFPVLMERILPSNYSPRLIRYIIVGCFVLFIPAFVIVLLFQNIYAYFAGAFIIAASGGIIWSFSTSILQIVTPNNFLGRVISYDLCFNINVAECIIFLLYGPLLNDALHLTSRGLAVIELITAVLSVSVWIFWLVLTRNVDHKMTPVDRFGNEILFTERTDKTEQIELEEQ